MKWLIDQLLVPATHRLGGYTGTFFTAMGMTQSDLTVVQAAVPIVFGFAVDLVVRKLL